MSLPASCRLVLAAGFLVAGFGCGSSSTSSGPPPDPSVFADIDLPFWTPDDFKDSPGGTEGKAAAFESQHPGGLPFHRGAFTYLELFPPDGLPGLANSSRGTPIIHEYGDFKTTFVYKQGIIQGAQSRDRTDKLIAEARIVRFGVSDKGERHIEAEEVHYNVGGTPQFYCKSTIKADGTKAAETETKGRKAKDYYFKWPGW